MRPPLVLEFNQLKNLLFCPPGLWPSVLELMFFVGEAVDSNQKTFHRLVALFN